ncbi:unnamed protein product, partial [Rotaria sordida]
CDYRVRIYSAYIKAVDGQPQVSSWGTITNTGDLLHEFQSESGWIHDVCFSPLDENLAWVSHNSIIFAVSAKNSFRESTLIVAGHEFSPLIYNYDERKGTIDFVEKLDQQETSTGKLAVNRLFDQPSMQTQIPEPISTHQSMITQMLPYQTDHTNIVKISSADLFGQVVIWNLSGRVNLKLDDVIYTIVFNAFAKLANDRAMKIGKKLLDEMSNDCRNNNIVLNSAIDMLMKFRDVESAERIFDSIKEKNIIIYSTMMKGYIGNEMSEKALDLFEKIDLKLDDVTYIIVFNACAKLANDRAMKIGKKLLHDMPNDYQNNNIVLNSAIDMLMKFGNVESAECIFHSIKKKDIITYGAMMKGCIGNEMSEKALDLFEKIDLKLDDVIYTIVFNACAQLANDRAMKIGRKLLREMPVSCRNNNIILNSAIDMLMKFGDVRSAECIFDSIKKKNIISYGALMSGYNINSKPWKCFKILEEMKQQGVVLNEHVWNILIGTCSKIVNGFGLNGMGFEAIELYRQMPNELHDEVTHICVLNACSHSGLLDQARNIFNEIPLKTEKIVTAMTDCLSRLFLFDEAEKLIDEYEKTNSPNFIMYMCLLSGVRNNRNKKLSEKIYNRMKSLFPDEKEGLTSSTMLVSNIYSSVAHDNSHPQSAEIHAEVNRMTSEVIKLGYKCDSSWVTRELQEEETIQSVLGGHSERLALAFNFIQRPVPDFIQITKNLRICGDCHAYTKLVAKARQRDIIIRDANRIHHFHKNGQCSCQDHF